VNIAVLLGLMSLTVHDEKRFSLNDRRLSVISANGSLKL
jgi:hypothetical protein